MLSRSFRQTNHDAAWTGRRAGSSVAELCGGHQAVQFDLRYSDIQFVMTDLWGTGSVLAVHHCTSLQGHPGYNDTSAGDKRPRCKQVRLYQEATGEQPRVPRLRVPRTGNPWGEPAWVLAGCACQAFAMERPHPAPHTRPSSRQHPVDAANTSTVKLVYNDIGYSSILVITTFFVV